MADIRPDHGEGLNWVIRASPPDLASAEPRAKSLYNRPGKEAIGYPASALAAHASHVTKVVLPEVDRGIPDRGVRKFEQPVTIEGRLPVPTTTVEDATMAGAADTGGLTLPKVAHIRPMTTCGNVRLVDVKGSRHPRKFAILFSAGLTGKDTYEKWGAGLKDYGLDLMHMTSLASNLWSQLPIKHNEIALLSDHEILTDDFLYPLAVEQRTSVQFIVAAPTKLKPEDSVEVPMPDGTTRMDYANNMETFKMKGKTASILNVAVTAKITDIFLGAFGYGEPFNHPVDEIARLWAEIILDDAAKWRHFGLRFHFALPLGQKHSYPDDVWRAFEKAMGSDPNVTMDHDCSSSWTTIKRICTA